MILGGADIIIHVLGHGDLISDTTHGTDGVLDSDIVGVGSMQVGAGVDGTVVGGVLQFIILVIITAGMAVDIRTTVIMAAIPTRIITTFITTIIFTRTEAGLQQE